MSAQDVIREALIQYYDGNQDVAQHVIDQYDTERTLAGGALVTTFYEGESVIDKLLEDKLQNINPFIQVPYAPADEFDAVTVGVEAYSPLRAMWAEAEEQLTVEGEGPPSWDQVGSVALEMLRNDDLDDAMDELFYVYQQAIYASEEWNL